MKSRLGLLIFFVATGVLSLGLWLYNGQRHTDDQLISPIGSSIPVRVVATPTPKANETLLITHIQEQIATVSGTYAVYVYEFGSKRGFGIHEHVAMPGASILKVPAIVSVLRRAHSGDASLSATLALQESDRRLGAGPLQFEKAGKTFSFERLIFEMGNKSDNTAWVMVNRALGKSYISETMQQLGMSESDYSEMTTTAYDVGVLFRSLYSNAYSDVGWKDIRGYLLDSIYEDRISVVLPTGVPLVHKVGTLEDAWMDAGVVEQSKGAFVLVIMNTGVKIGEAQIVVPKIARLVWDYERLK